MMPSIATQSLTMSAYEPDPSLLELPPNSDAPYPARSCLNNSKSEAEGHKTVEALRNGDEDAFGLLINRYHSRLIRFARTFVPSQAIAEEVVQETWMAVLEGIGRFEERSSLKTWILQILSNRAKTRGQREHRYLPFSDVSHSTESAEDDSVEPERFHTSGPLTGSWASIPATWEDTTPERLLLSKESLAHIEQAIRRLPPIQQQMMTLRDLEGISSEEICQLMGTSPSNQRVILHRARAKVRRALNHYLQGPSDTMPTSHP